MFAKKTEGEKNSASDLNGFTFAEIGCRFASLVQREGDRVSGGGIVETKNPSHLNGFNIGFP